MHTPPAQCRRRRASPHRRGCSTRPEPSPAPAWSVDVTSTDSLIVRGQLTTPARNLDAEQTNQPAAQAGGRGEPSAALRNTVTSTLIMGSPVRHLTNPITRCWVQPHHRYAGTDDGRGTDQTLDAERLTLMRGRIASRRTPPRGPASRHRRVAERDEHEVRKANKAGPS